jgi:hypothetical protein
MAIWMAVVLAAAGLPPQEDRLPRTLQSDENPPIVEGFIGVRTGVWMGRSFDFQSVRTDSTEASSDQQALFSASLYGGVQFYEHLAVMLSYEADIASKISASVGGAYLGWREHPKERYGKGVPDEVLIFAGVVTGRISVDSPDFGSFKRGVGFSGGLMLGWSLSSHWTVQLDGEYRFLKFDYKRDVLSGDTSIGGNTVWIGLGLDYRF